LTNLTGPSRAVQVFLVTAAAVLLCDLLSKELALRLLTGATPQAAGGIGFELMLNSGAAGGVQLGEYTRLINIASMSVVAALVVLVVRQVSAIHRLAPVVLGLIAGAALGNSVSLLLRPAVVDFISLGGGAMVVNVADLAAFAGVAGLVPVAFGIVARIRDEGRTEDAVRHQIAEAPRPQVLLDREVPIALASEVAIEPGLPGRTGVQDRATIDKVASRSYLVSDEVRRSQSPEEQAE
jgi:lipoprotein signal peptidase